MEPHSDLLDEMEEEGNMITLWSCALIEDLYDHFTAVSSDPSYPLRKLYEVVFANIDLETLIAVLPPRPVGYNRFLTSIDMLAFAANAGNNPEGFISRAELSAVAGLWMLSQRAVVTERSEVTNNNMETDDIDSNSDISQNLDLNSSESSLSLSSPELPMDLNMDDDDNSSMMSMEILGSYSPVIQPTPPQVSPSKSSQGEQVTSSKIAPLSTELPIHMNIDDDDVDDDNMSTISIDTLDRCSPVIQTTSPEVAGSKISEDEDVTSTTASMDFECIKEDSNSSNEISVEEMEVSAITTLLDLFYRER